MQEMTAKSAPARDRFRPRLDGPGRRQRRLDEIEDGEGRPRRDPGKEIMGRDAGDDGEIRAGPLQNAEAAPDRRHGARAAVEDGFGPVRDLGEAEEDDGRMVLVPPRQAGFGELFEETSARFRAHAAEDADRPELLLTHRRASLILSRGRASAICPSLPSVRTALKREFQMASSEASAAAWKSGEIASSRSMVTVRVVAAARLGTRTDEAVEKATA